MDTTHNLDRRKFLKATGISLLTGCSTVELSLSKSDKHGKNARPNILFFITDDQSWPHTGAYGAKGVKTPAFDWVAKNGALFNYAYVAAPSCSPSRASILTGQDIWRLEEAAVFGVTLQRKFDVFPLLLEKSGYHIGWCGKAWGPGALRPGGCPTRVGNTAPVRGPFE